jgi:uncharacterized membrane protein YdjX (TVP38/TMEM64 family)
MEGERGASSPREGHASGENRRLGGALATVATIGAVLLAAAIAWRWLESSGGAGALPERFGRMAPFVSIPIHVLLSATPFPSELVGVANGSAYGLWAGALYSWIGWWCGAALEYGLVRLGTRQVDPGIDRGRQPRWLRRFPVGHPVFLIVGRQLPFGFHTVNILAGLGGVAPSRHLVCAAISNLPYAFFTAAAGSTLNVP